MLKEGESIPSFSVPDENGEIVKSADFKGKNIVIYFYPKDFTPGCTTEADEFSKDHAKFTKADIRIIGISPDDSEKHKKFCDKMGIKYTLLADTSAYILFGACHIHGCSTQKSSTWYGSSCHRRYSLSNPSSGNSTHKCWNKPCSYVWTCIVVWILGISLVVLGSPNSWWNHCWRTDELYLRGKIRIHCINVKTNIKRRFFVHYGLVA